MWADIVKLKDAGYTVEERSQWHYQVVTGRATINIWPSKKKYMREYGSGASFYTNIVATIEGLVGKPHATRTVEDVQAAIERKQRWWQTQVPIPRFPALYEAHRYELDLLVAYIKRLSVDKKNCAR